LSGQQKGGLGLVEAAGELLHPAIADRLIQQHHGGTVALTRNGGKGLHQNSRDA
jgi:hypothetical protein